MKLFTIWCLLCAALCLVTIAYAVAIGELNGSLYVLASASAIQLALAVLAWRPRKENIACDS